MKLAPIKIEHGERFGRLTVLRKVVSKERGPRYACGCACGYQKVVAKANDLMKGRVTACIKCRNPAPQSASDGDSTSAVSGC